MAALVSADSTANKPQGASPAELSTLLDDLKSGDLDQVKNAILRVRRNPADATKLLIDGLRQASADARRGQLVDPWFCDVTLSLLSELRAKDAVPAILELLRLPGSLPEDLLEDGITETAPRVLAGLAGDQLELLNAMARDERLNEWSRAATIQTRAYLVRDGVLSREAAIKDLQHLLREAIDRSDRTLGGPLVIELATLGACEAYSMISEAIRSGIVEEGLINLEELEEELGEADYSQHSLARLPPTHVDDTIAEIEGWNWTREADLFDDDPLEMFAPSALTGSTRLTDAEQLFSDESDGSRPIRHAGHVGRNEPCPCGSGRKFKKCCGKPGT